MRKRYISEMNEIYEFTIESCRQGYLVRADGWPMATCDTMQEAEQEAERIARDLMLHELPADM